MDNGEGPKPNEVKKGSELVSRHDWSSKMWDGSTKTYDAYVANDDFFVVADGTRHDSGIDWREQRPKFTVRDNSLAMAVSGFGDLSNALNKRIRLESMFSSMTSGMSDLVSRSDAQVGGVGVIGDEAWYGGLGMMGLYVESNGVFKRMSNPPVGNIKTGESDKVWNAAEKSKTGDGLTEDEKFWWNFSRGDGSTIRSLQGPEITSFKIKPGDKVWILTESVWRNLTLDKMKQAKNAEQMVDMARKEPGVSTSLDFSAMLINIEKQSEEKQPVEPEVLQKAPEMAEPEPVRLVKGVRTRVGENGRAYELVLAKGLPGERTLYVGRPNELGVNNNERVLVSDGIGEGANWLSINPGKAVIMGREPDRSGATYAKGEIDLTPFSEISRKHVKIELDNSRGIWVTDTSIYGTWGRELAELPTSGL